MRLSPEAQATYLQEALLELETSLKYGTLMRPEHVAALLNMTNRELGYVARNGGMPGVVKLSERIYRYQAPEIASLLKAGHHV